MSKDTDKYEVGFGKPPKHTRFQKGRSGNPRGRPSGSRSLNTELDEVLSTLVTVVENGQQKKVSTQKAALLRLLEKTLKGDARSLDSFLKLAQQRSSEKEAHAVGRKITAADEDILVRFKQDTLAEAAGSQPIPDGEATPDEE